MLAPIGFQVLEPPVDSLVQLLDIVAPRAQHRSVLVPVAASSGDEAVRVREETAAQVNKALCARYDRLRRTRSNDVVVPLMGGACGACHTAVPLNRRSQIKAGTVIDACEACGAILYPTEPAGSV